MERHCGAYTTAAATLLETVPHPLGIGLSGTPLFLFGFAGALGGRFAAAGADLVLDGAAADLARGTTADLAHSLPP